VSLSDRLGFLQLPLRYLIALGVSVLLALAVLSFVRVTVADLELRAQQQSLERDIASLKVENARLRGQLTYLQTDAAVEKLAREQLGWTKPGDTAVVVIRPPTTPTAAAR